LVTRFGVPVDLKRHAVAKSYGVSRVSLGDQPAFKSWPLRRLTRTASGGPIQFDSRSQFPLIKTTTSPPSSSALLFTASCFLAHFQMHATLRSALQFVSDPTLYYASTATVHFLIGLFLGRDTQRAFPISNTDLLPLPSRLAFLSVVLLVLPLAFPLAFPLALSLTLCQLLHLTLALALAIVSPIRYFAASVLRRTSPSNRRSALRS
jgi:hypothetical protein